MLTIHVLARRGVCLALGGAVHVYAGDAAMPSEEGTWIHGCMKGRASRPFLGTRVREGSGLESLSYEGACVE